MLTAPLENSLIRMDEELKQGALHVFVLVHVAFTCCCDTSTFIFASFPDLDYDCKV